LMPFWLKLKALVLVVAALIAFAAWFAERDSADDLATFRYWNRSTDSGTTRALFPIRVDGREGFMDSDGKVVIEPRFEKTYPFTEGLAAVMLDGKWGYIDERGTQVIPPTFRTAGLFREGRAQVRMEFTSGYGYIDPTGAMVISARFDAASDFVDGVARVGHETAWSKVRGRFADVGLECSYHYIARDGKRVAKPALTNPPIAKVHPLAPIKVNGKMGFADAEGKIVIEPRFDYVAPFENGLALFTVEGGAKYGYVDEAGRIVWPASK
jgi:hypothetical protein